MDNDFGRPPSERPYTLRGGKNIILRVEEIKMDNRFIGTKEQWQSIKEKWQATRTPAGEEDLVDFANAVVREFRRGEWGFDIKTISDDGTVVLKTREAYDTRELSVGHRVYLRRG